MLLNTEPPADEFIARLASEQGKSYTADKSGDERFHADDGRPIWPSNNGGIGTPEIISLRKGEKVLTRYGRTAGRYVSPRGTTVEERAMPRNTDKTQYYEYEVIDEITAAEKSRIAPWFGQKGLVTQYKLPKSVEKLLADKKLRELKNND